MFELKTISLTKKVSNEKEITLLFDTESCCPCLYPLLYSMKILRFQSPSTQYSDLTALKSWYKFWFDKYSSSFCESFYSSSYNFEIIQNEIDNFIVYLENKNELNNIIILRNDNIDYGTISKRIRSFFKFYNFLLDDYLTIYAQPLLTRKEIERIKLNIRNYIILKKKILINFLR